MTTTGGATPTTLNCPGCGALVYYEGHSELRGTLVPHRFHCHACGRAYIVRSTSHKQPRFALSARHEVRGGEAMEHDHEQEHTHEEAIAPSAAAAPASGGEASGPAAETPKQG